MKKRLPKRESSWYPKRTSPTCVKDIRKIQSDSQLIKLITNSITQIGAEYLQNILDQSRHFPRTVCVWNTVLIHIISVKPVLKIWTKPILNYEYGSEILPNPMEEIRMHKLRQIHVQ